MGVFFQSLFTVLGSNIGLVISGLLGAGGIYCIASPRGRTIVKGAFNYFFSNASNNPKIAAGVFDEKLKELRGMLRKAEDMNQEAQGKLVETSDRLRLAQRDERAYSRDAVALEKRGKHEEALLLAQKAQQARQLAAGYEEQIPDYQAMADAANQRVNEVKAKIEAVKQKKEVTISNIEKGNFEKRVSEELKGLELTDIDAHIAQIEEGASKKKYQAIGARMSYEESDAKKIQDAQQAAQYIDAADFLQTLMLEANNDHNDQ